MLDKPPAPATASQCRQAATSRYDVPPPNSSPGTAAFLRGAEMSLPPVWLLALHRDLSRGVRCRAGSQTSSPPHTYCQSDKRCQPGSPGPAFSAGMHPVPCERTAPKGMGRPSLQGLPGTDKAACLHHAAGFISQPAKEWSVQGAGE